MIKTTILTFLLFGVFISISHGDELAQANLNTAEERVADLLKNSKEEREENASDRNIASASKEDEMRLQEFNAIFSDYYTP